MEVQNLFNHLDLVDRALKHHYTATWKSWKDARPEVSADFGTRAIKVILRFHSPDNLVKFDVHAYLSTSLKILGDSEMLDPKTIFLLRKIYFYGSKQLST